MHALLPPHEVRIESTEIVAPDVSIRQSPKSTIFISVSKSLPEAVPIPMLNAAVLSILHEGRVRDPSDAERLLSSGAVRLELSHTRSVVALQV